MRGQWESQTRKDAKYYNSLPDLEDTGDEYEDLVYNTDYTDEVCFIKVT